MIGEMGLNGDVQARMDAYRGNPQGLMQRYAQSQELVDLLALQKLKSEKEAAAREMQMQMESAGLPTVAQQREQEVMDLTKKEVAEQSGIGGQQQAMQQQRAMQNLMQAAGAPQGRTGMPAPQPNQPPRSAGVAGLPSPNMMPPKAMAAGGIIAFAEGDPVPAPEDEEERRRKATGNMGSMAEQGIRSLMSYSPERLREERTRGAREAFDLTPEERAQREAQIREMRQYDERMMSPERRRSEGLTRWLLGAANRSGIGSALSGAGAAATNYQSEMDQLARRRMMERQGRETELSDIGRSARGAAFEAGSAGEKLGLESLGRGVTAATSLQEAMIRAMGADGTGGLSLQDAIRIAQTASTAKNRIQEEMKVLEGRNLLNQDPEKARTPQLKESILRDQARYRALVAERDRYTTVENMGLQILNGMPGMPTQPSADQTTQAQSLPQSKEQLVPNTVYNTARGPARWDGNQFIPVQ